MGQNETLGLARQAKIADREALLELLEEKILVSRDVAQLATLIEQRDVLDDELRRLREGA